jgi:hypothetical protein
MNLLKAPLRRLAALAALLAGPAFAALLAGCGVEEQGRLGDDSRHYENGRYTDVVLGLAVDVPRSWDIEVGTLPYSPWDLAASRKQGLIEIWHSFATPDESLDAYVAHRTGEENSYARSEIVHPPVLRNGVRVIAVDQWMPYLEWDEEEEWYEEVGTQRRRILYFERANRIVTLRMSDEEGAFSADPAYARVDSSLTFF